MADTSPTRGAANVDLTQLTYRGAIWRDMTGTTWHDSDEEGCPAQARRFRGLRQCGRSFQEHRRIPGIDWWSPLRKENLS
jgi:hypothetical protein